MRSTRRGGWIIAAAVGLAGAASASPAWAAGEAGGAMAGGHAGGEMGAAHARGGLTGAAGHEVSVSPAPEVHSAPAVSPEMSGSGREGGHEGDHHGFGRAEWRHHVNGGYAYGTPILPFGYDDALFAGSDGYYGGYYGYAPGYPYGTWETGNPATGSNNAVTPNAANDVPPGGSGGNNGGNTAAPAQPAAPSPVATAAQIQNSIDNSPQLIAANAAIAKDQQAYDAQRRRVIDALQNDPKYQAALRERHQYQAQVNQIRTQEVVPNPVDVMPAANAELQAGDAVTRLQTQAVQNDPAAKAAKDKLDQDIQKRDQLRQELQAKYRPQVSG